MEHIVQPAIALISLAAVASGTMIYPKIAPSPITFLCAIGIPVEDLPFESVISGYALRMQYFLPNNATEITRVYLKPQPITHRKNIQNELNLGSVYRWIFYRGIEMVLQSMNLPGHSCLLRVICEHAALPFSHESGLLAELLHILLTPSSTKDLLERRKDRTYLLAERFGRRGGNCASAFDRTCERSTLDLITVLV